MTDIYECRSLAKNFGGKCLSKKYVRSIDALVWKCFCGNVFEKSHKNVKRGSWCSCSQKYKRLSIDKMKDVAKANGGKCLSQKYINNKEKLIWECSERHIWEAIPDNVINKGKWCPHCAGNAKYSIEYINEKIKNKGECISKTYMGAKVLHKFRCNKGHEWESCPTKIMNGRWCIYCSQSYPERVVRVVFESIFNSKFEKYKPTWLVSEAGHQLELDGFNHDLNIAFEHNGLQHYDPNTIFSSEKLFENDIIKRKLCISNGVKLFEINQLFNVTRLNDLVFMLYDYCSDKSIPFTKINNKYIFKRVREDT